MTLQLPLVDKKVKLTVEFKQGDTLLEGQSHEDLLATVEWSVDPDDDTVSIEQDPVTDEWFVTPLKAGTVVVTVTAETDEDIISDTLEIEVTD